MGSFEFGIIGTGNLIALFGQTLLLKRNGSETDSQLKTLAQIPKESKLVFLLLMAFIASELFFNFKLTSYFLASLLVIFPLYDWQRKTHFIRKSELSLKSYYLSAATMKAIGFSLLFFGVSLWTFQLKVNVI